jgi:hypothetical protein
MGVDGDWTWVLERQCDECGYKADALSRDQLGARIRVVGGEWRQLLGRGPLVEQLRDDDDRTWTPLQYGCHVRDVFDLMEERTRTMLKKRKPPTFKDWDQEKAAEKGKYSDQDPAKVAYDLASKAGKFADLIDRVNGDEWDKAGTRSDGKSFTVESLARYTLHDVEHHLWDARDQIDG